MSIKHPTWLLPIGENGGALIMMPCPGTQKVDLNDTLSQLQKQEINAIFSVMPTEEMIRLKVEDLPNVCQQYDIQWFNLSVGNHQIPDNKAFSAWLAYKNKITQLINQGDKVAVHCKGGTGRTGLGVAMILLELGWTAKQAISDIKTLKPSAFSRESYVEYIENIAENISKSK